MLTPVFLSFLQQGPHRRSKMTPTSPRRNGLLGSMTPLPLRLSVLVLLLLSAGPPGARCLDFNYHDARALHDFLKNVSHTYPSITHLYSVGESVQGGSSLLILLFSFRPATSASPVCVESARALRVHCCCCCCGGVSGGNGGSDGDFVIQTNASITVFTAWARAFHGA